MYKTIAITNTTTIFSSDYDDVISDLHENSLIDLELIKLFKQTDQTDQTDICSALISLTDKRNTLKIFQNIDDVINYIFSRQETLAAFIENPKHNKITLLKDTYSEINKLFNYVNKNLDQLRLMFQINQLLDSTDQLNIELHNVARELRTNTGQPYDQTVDDIIRNKENPTDWFVSFQNRFESLSLLNETLRNNYNLKNEALIKLLSKYKDHINVFQIKISIHECFQLPIVKLLYQLICYINPREIQGIATIVNSTIVNHGSNI